MPDSTHLRLLWLLSVLAEAALVWRITTTGMATQFALFRVYLIASITASLATAIGGLVFSGSYAYHYLFIAWCYLSTVFEFLVLHELSSLALKPFPAIQAASRRTLQAFWVILIVIVVGWYCYLSLSPADKFPVLRAALRYQDSTSIAFAIFVFIFLAFLAWMPVPLSRNRLAHSFLMGALFLCTALSRFVLELGNFAAQAELGNYIGGLGTVFVAVVWLARVKPGPDDTLNTPRGPVNRAEAEQMLQRLSELNAALARSGPRMLR